MKKLRIIPVLLLIVILTGCQKEVLTHDFDYFYFDTSISIKVYYTDENQYDFEKIDHDIDQILNELQSEFDTTDENSLISKLNSTGKVTMTDDFKNIYEKSLEACQATDGHFDATSGKLIDLWSINNENHIPSEAEITEALKTVDCNQGIVNGNSLEIPEGTAMDFGSIVKGYAADKIEAYLKSQGIDSALLNLGGNVQTIGTKPDKTDFRIGVMKPEVDNLVNENALVVTASDKAVVTSGINQRFFEKDGEIYHHILDAKLGKPVNNELASVTIITDKGINADTLSTVAFIKGLEEGYKFIESLPDVDAIFITRDKKYYVTDENLEIELVDEQYQEGTLN